MTNTPIQITTDISKILERIESKFDKIDKIDEKFEQKLDSIQQDVNELKVGQARLEAKLDGVEQKLEAQI
jgi:prefoldin subunit 5